MKRFLTLLCTLALVLCLFPATAFAAGEGNMDSGGGGMGQGTSTNKWTPGNDGVRITVVDAETGAAVSTLIDYSNTVQSGSVLHFGKVSKLQYLGGTSLSPQSGIAYSCKNPVNPMPTIVSSTGRNNIESIKRYFCSEYACMMIAEDTGVSYEAMLAGKYKLLVEPLTYFTHNGLYYCMTATEAALYDQMSGGALRSTMTSLTVLLTFPCKPFLCLSASFTDSCSSFFVPKGNLIHYPDCIAVLIHIFSVDTLCTPPL